jgi:C_GCAxxG_C_C family probable redox protein
MQPQEIARSLFDNEFNCAQSVFAAFAESANLDPHLATKIAAPFGAGIGRMGNTCGAVSGALMAIGLHFGNDDSQDTEAKEKAYLLARTFYERFTHENGSTLCRELIGYDVSQPEELDHAREAGVFSTRCPLLVEDAASILMELLEENS